VKTFVQYHADGRVAACVETAGEIDVIPAGLEIAEVADKVKAYASVGKYFDKTAGRLFADKEKTIDRGTLVIERVLQGK